MQAQHASTRKKQSFLHGALIMTVSIVIIKIIGALFKIPLKWAIGTDGFGYFNTAYNFYAPIFSLATAGFPIAIARMVSENYARRRFRDIRQIHRVSVPIFLVTGSIGFIIMLVGAPIYVKVIDNSSALAGMYVLAPAILFSCLSSVYRGYYEGLRNMYPTAISEIIESAGKLVIGLAVAILIVKAGMNQYYASGTVFGVAVQSEEYAKNATLPYAAAGAIFGEIAGSITSFLFLLISHRKGGDGITEEELQASCPPHSARDTIVKLVKTAIPIGIGAIAINVASLIDTTFLQMRIGDIMNSSSTVLLDMYKGIIPQINIDKGTVPNYLFGCYSVSLTLFALIPAITQAFGVSALPNVTAAWTRGVPDEIKKSMGAVLRITSLVSIPTGLGMAVLARPIVTLVFGQDEIASRVLMIMGIGAVFASLSVPINSMLQAVGRVDLPVKLLLVGLTLKVVLNYVLSGIPQVNVLGAGTGTLVCYAFIAVFAMILLCRVTHIIPDMKSVFIKPLFASCICVTAAYLVQIVAARIMPDRLATCAAIVAAGVVYIIALLLLKAISRDDILMLPKGQKLAAMLERRNWIS